MIIKTEDSELEIYNGADVYFGSRTSGQIFKRWGDFEDNEKIKLEILQKKIEKLVSETENILFGSHLPGHTS